jgi:ribonuclease VapC
LIVVDTSALMAILLEEDGHTEFLSAIEKAPLAVMAAPTQFEYLMVSIGKLTDSGLPLARSLLTSLNIKIEDYTEEHANIAADAFLRFGKGQGHPAQLNFGDCMAYALAKLLNAPLLHKGNDFSKTDI